jgi:membrane protein required for colicin V production
VSVADAIILSVMLLSGLLALMRGLTRELFSIIAWVLALLTAVLLVDALSPGLRKVLGGAPVFDILVAGVLFVAALLVLSFFSDRIYQKIHGPQSGPIDRTLGFVFGLARGVAIIAIGYWFLSWTLDGDKEPKWAETSRLMPIVKSVMPAIDGAVAIVSDEEPKRGASKKPDKPKAKSAKPAASGSGSGGSGTAAKTPEKTEEDTGYSQSDRRALDQLYETTTQN